MKRTNLYIAYLLCCMLFLFAACDKEPLSLDTGSPVEPDSTPKSIAFRLDELQTKGSIESVDSILSLGVFGYSTGTTLYDQTDQADRLPNLIYNQEAWRANRPLQDGKNRNAWQYNPVAYWPTDQTINNSFFAYSPHSSKFPPEAEFTIPARIDTGYPKIAYTVPNRVVDQVDVLYASPVFNKNLTNNSEGVVNYQMKHALSWLIFVAAPVQRADTGDGDNKTDTFKIKSLRFIVDTLITRAELNLGTGEWTPLEASSADYEFVVDTARKIPANTMATITPASSRLMIIPQAFTQAANPSAIDVYFTVSGDSDTSDDDDEYFYSIPFPDTKLHPGGVTIYLLRLSTEGVKVEFYDYNNIDPWLNGEPWAPAPIDVF